MTDYIASTNIAGKFAVIVRTIGTMVWAKMRPIVGQIWPRFRE